MERENMEKVNKFFVKPEYGVEPGRDNQLYQINIDDINYLSLFATTLEPLPEVAESNGYLAALNNYYSNNSDGYSDCYHNLVTSSYGKMFLSTTINLVLLEKEIRFSGLNENVLKSYAKCVEDYQHQIKFNQSMYVENTEEIDHPSIRKA